MIRHHGYLVFVATLTALGAMSALNAEAGLLRVESQTLFSARNNQAQQLEKPLYEFFESSYVADSRIFEFNTDFSLSAAPGQAQNEANLYILDVVYRPVPEIVSVRAGRSFNSETAIRTATTDSIRVDWSLLSKRVTTGATLGIERRLVQNTLDAEWHIIGAHLDYRSSSAFPFFLGSKYVYRKPYTGAASVQHLLGVSAHKPIVGGWSPELLANTETSLSASRLNRGEVGVDLYPSLKTSLRWRLLTHEVDGNGESPSPIFSTFAVGRLYETSGQFEYIFNRALSASILAAYDNYLLQLGDRTQGYRVELESKYSSGKFGIGNSLYFFKSYGGLVYGDRIRFRQSLSDRVQLDQAADITYYEKITSSQRPAINLEAWIRVWLWDRFRLDWGAELNSNNHQRYDARIAAKLTYLLWREL
jgi:hypothetical protein